MSGTLALAAHFQANDKFSSHHNINKLIVSQHLNVPFNDNRIFSGGYAGQDDDSVLSLYHLSICENNAIALAGIVRMMLRIEQN